MSTTVDLPFDTLGLSQQGRVLTVVFRSPPHNFVTFAFIREWDVLTRAVDRDGSIGAVVVTAEPGLPFMTHVDPEDVGDAIRLPISSLRAELLYPGWKLARMLLRLPAVPSLTRRFGGPVGRALVFGSQWRRSLLRMSRSSTVYLAAINGHAVAGGCEFALGCDIRYACDAPDVRFGQIEILAGVVPGGGGALRLPRMIGTARALEHMLDGAPITAAQALEWGVVSKVLPAQDLVAATQATAARLAQRSPRAIRAIKQLTHGSTSQSLSTGLDRAMAAFGAAAVSRPVKATLPALLADIAETGSTPLSAGEQRWVQGTRVDHTDHEPSGR
ncbi:enoyl-CoA hydratase/isomerase family protein [Nocardia mexicana]|uniref:Enoyl-CoA hydratase/carnithine racemase n=1 Tax=Nocardia mexicana TaxID=279262 RepID=A0A370GN33_9NOCA|nr:enoyl-CoA hydratase/isomerase family protein [Nocardia mexicana]RDI43313.1 enoyl-CoA hydratase/carnithine racemase [Nocardia mexicana]